MQKTEQTLKNEKPKSNKYLVSVLIAKPPTSFKTEILGETSLDWIFNHTEAAQIIVTKVIPP